MFSIRITGIAESQFLAPTMTKIISVVDPNTPISYSNAHVERFHDISLVEETTITVHYILVS